MVRKINKKMYPDQKGYQRPAEWEKHYGTWMSYPHETQTFFEKLDDVRNTYVELIKVIAQGEIVHVNVCDKEMKADLEKRLKKKKVTGNVKIHIFPTNDAWCRDHGAIFIKNRKNNNVAATCWKFNSWGGKYPHDLDESIPGKMAEYLKMDRYETGMILEGGSIEVNGNGVCLATESCLLNPNRNHDMSREEIEGELQKYLGVKKILWLGEGITGDDTDGHIDDITRFVNETTLLTVVEEEQSSIDFEPLKENLNRLITYTDIEGRPFNIVTLPMPDPVMYKGNMLPASYANFYIANSAVIVPTFNCWQDKAALDIIGRYFPDRKVVGIDSSDVVIGLGSFHCLTQQIPKEG
ncbi:agmatine/peptidylarginine deiminase [Candidatus Auribacterota bacterium]